MAADHDELLPLAVVPVFAFGDAGLGNVDTHLPTIESMNQLSERAACIAVHLQVENRILFREVAEIGAIEPLGKRGRRHLRNQEGPRHIVELMQEVNYRTERRLVGDGAVAVAALL